MINENALKVPPVIILNNVLSRLKQDIVTIASHGVQMGLVSVFSTQKEYNTSDPSILSRLSFGSWSWLTQRCEWHFQSQVRAESNMGWEKDVANTVQRMNEEYRVPLRNGESRLGHRHLRSYTRNPADQPHSELLQQQGRVSHRRRGPLPEGRNNRGEEPDAFLRRRHLVSPSLPRFQAALR